MTAKRMMLSAMGSLAVVALSSCRAPESSSPSIKIHKEMTCPRLKGSTPWDLDAPRGVDFWICEYRDATTKQPIASIYVGNHPATPTLEFEGFYPEGSGSGWFGNAEAGRAWPRSYWSFRENLSQSMSVTVIHIEVTSHEDFKAKATLVQAFEH